MAEMTVSQLVAELNKVKNPSIVKVSITTAGVVTKGVTISVSHADEVAGGIDLAASAANKFVITGAA